jgi:flagellar hook assembly protein FlgD
VALNVYDASGRLVTTLLDRTEDAGLKTVSWSGTTSDGTEIANGVYFYRLETKNQSLVRKLVLTR